MHNCIITTYRVKYRKRNKYKYAKRIKFLAFENFQFLNFIPIFWLDFGPEGKKEKKKTLSQQIIIPEDPLRCFLFAEWHISDCRLFALPTRTPSQPRVVAFEQVYSPHRPLSLAKIQSWHKHMVVIIDSWFSTRGVLAPSTLWLRVSRKRNACT